MTVHICTLEPTNQTNKKRAVLEPQTPSQMDISLPVRQLMFVHDHFFTLYVFIRTNGRSGKNAKKKTKKVPAAGRQREHGLGRYL